MTVDDKDARFDGDDYEDDFDEDGRGQYGFHDSDITPQPGNNAKMDAHLIDRFLTFIADAQHGWISAGMPLEKSLALMRILHNLHFVMFGKVNTKMDIANIMAAYAGKDRLAINAAERILTNTHKQSMDTEMLNKFFGGAFGSSKSGVKPASTGER